MDPIRALDMEFRSGISPSEVDDFANRMDLISQAMEEIKNGTFDPNKCKIPGYQTPEQEETERLEAIKHEEERVRREQERERKHKHEERENWWMKAKLRFSVEDDDDEHNDSQHSTSKQERAQFAASRALAAYKERDANDYSMWAKWEPQDPVTLEENAERDALVEKQRNKEFEANNPDFCSQFKEDIEKRQRTKQEKERVAEKCKQQGNLSYKRKQYKAATHSYMQALDKAPFNVAVLTNLAQCHLRMNNLDDAVEFSSRALFVNPEHVKALSRRAAAWHLQKRWKDAAMDMEKALQLEPGNQDVVEQHSIIAGDYEDSIAQTQLEVKLANTKKCEGDDERTKTYELQFLAELFKRMEETHRPPVMDNQELQENQEAEADAQGQGALGMVHPSWVAYELVLPFLEKNESARTLFRTSSELHKLCGRLVSIFETEQTSSQDKAEDSSQDRELIVSAMINCAAAAMGNCPRNQIVLYQNAAFRKCVLAALTRAADVHAGTSLALPWSTQASVLRFFEEAVESKSWKRVMTATKSVLPTLLALIQLSVDTNQGTTNSNEALSTFDRVSKQNLMLSASSICFTLSSDDHGIREFAQAPQDCIQAIATAFTTWKAMDPRLLSNLLGFLTNLSTAEAFRAAVDGLEGSVRLRLIQDLLSIAGEAAVSSDFKTRSSEGEAQQVIAERALAALLNLSYHADARIRVDLITSDFVTTLTGIFSTMNPGSFSNLVLVLSRAISLLCRVHPVLAAGTTPVTNESTMSSNDFVQTAKQLTERDLLELLYRMCLQALSSTNASNADNKTTSSQLPGETWQLCAQIWCHVGWCVHELHVREYLREKRAVHAMFQAIVLSNGQTEDYRPSASSSQETSARERLVGNIVKVLITMQSDRNQQDAKIFSGSKNLKALVDALRSLPDGLARKNVAILLAKLCQADQTVKGQVRELRGIEMMLAVSQSLKNVGGKGLPQRKQVRQG